MNVTRLRLANFKRFLAWFGGATHDQGGGSYQPLTNAALRDHIDAARGHR